MPANITNSNIETLPLDQLHFDPHNPRFARYFGTQTQPEADIIERMINHENVQELMASIGEQSYFPGEPLLVAQNPDNGGYIVVEGNRRLAALKLMNGEYVEKELPSISHIRETLKAPSPQQIPCIIFKQRRDILRYLGYRHITGAKRWDSLSKARYLQQLLDTFFKDQPQTEQLSSIAKEIGSKPHYVAQMLTGLKVFEDAKQHEFYGLQRLEEKDIDFSVLTTALARPSLSAYIGLESARDMSAENLDRAHSKELFSWLFAQDAQGYTILGESRNLGKLAAVVGNPYAIRILKETGSLDTAFIFSDGPQAAFSKVLQDADKKLREVYKLTSEIDDFHDAHLTQIEQTADLADDIRSLVRRALRRRKDALNG